ncbi:THAP-type domain-containing protein [Aphis craccivora]|uniref:THAP-type domain-containing protein n=1 Tax=Aphis craccivora TaxID=307492 RepID=A0A6G0YHM9_APHCR|nr:THAP-type domain-containing protein [Aphis craccivora]
MDKASKKKQFLEHHLSPEKKKNQIFKKPVIIANEPTCDDNPLLEFEVFQEDPIDLSLRPQEIDSFKPSNLELENYSLAEKNKNLQLQINNLSIAFSFENLCQKEDLVKFYTGLPSNEIFLALFNLLKNCEIHYYLDWKVSSISKPDQLLITLMKLRHNFPHLDLSVRFGCSVATISNVTITWINILHNILFNKFMNKIPSRHKNKTCLPNAFKKFPNCRVVIDCTEIVTSVSRLSMNAQRDTYSSYKHRNNWKVLVGIAPNGVVTFVSDLFPGSTSDKVITLKSGLLEQLVPGDLVMADKGFLIQDILPPGVLLNIPPFLDTPQFTHEQIIQTESIAKARIHIERAIQRIKCYDILNLIPFSLLKQANSIFQVIAALTNLQPPLLQEIKDKM